MNKFELFCLLFLFLDEEWDETHNEELGDFLSGMNPFLFDDIGSADTATYDEFCSMISTPIDVETSFETAWDYVHKLNIPVVTTAFSYVSKDEWVEFADEYLSEPHKGQSI